VLTRDYTCTLASSMKPSYHSSHNVLLNYTRTVFKSLLATKKISRFREQVVLFISFGRGPSTSLVFGIRPLYFPFLIM